MSAGTQNEFERLLARVARIEEERDALAAKLKRIYDAWGIDDTGIHDKRVEHVRLPYLRYEAVNQAIMAAPATSLASLIAEKQATILERFGDKWDWEERAPSHKDFRVAAMAIRRQAEQADMEGKG